MTSAEPDKTVVAVLPHFTQACFAFALSVHPVHSITKQNIKRSPNNILRFIASAPLKTNELFPLIFECTEITLNHNTECC